MKCLRCQHDNAPAQKFCGDCGARLDAACPACGAPQPSGQKFCGECGASIGPGPGSRFHDPGAYTPRHLAEKILSSPGGGARGRAQAGHRALRRPQGLPSSCSPIAIPEEAPRPPRPGPSADDGRGPPLRGNGEPGDGRRDHGAVRSAGRPRGSRGPGLLHGAPASRKRSSATLKRYAGGKVCSFHVRVGLNSGEVVVRSIGSDLRMDYSAVGQTTHLAARMEQMAMPGSISHRLHTSGPRRGAGSQA